MKPVLFATGNVPAYRAGALARLHELEGIEVALFGGRGLHGGEQHRGQLPFPHRHVRPAELYALAASGRYRAVVASTAGRLAPLAAWAGARRARVALLLWSSLWAHPRTPPHALSYLALLRLYRSADAVVTYGPHVSAYVRARGARNVHVAAQSVDNSFWSSELPSPQSAGWAAGAEARFLFVGRAAREKGIEVLLAAWRSTGLRRAQAALLLATHGAGAPALGGRAAGAASRGGEGTGAGDGVVMLGRLAPVELRDVYAACDVLVVPSIPTRTFREPWGLVANEAMNRGLAVIASDAVGAAAGGLVRDGRNGLVVRAGDASALAGAIRRLAEDRGLRERLGSAGAEDVRAYTHEAWAQGFSRALASLQLARRRC